MIITVLAFSIALGVVPQDNRDNELSLLSLILSVKKVESQLSLLEFQHEDGDQAKFESIRHDKINGLYEVMEAALWAVIYGSMADADRLNPAAEGFNQDSQDILKDAKGKLNGLRIKYSL